MFLWRPKIRNKELVLCILLVGGGGWETRSTSGNTAAESISCNITFNEGEFLSFLLSRKDCSLPLSQGSLLVKGFDRRQQTISLWCLKKMRPGHRRRKVLNIGRGGGGGKVQNIERGGGGGANFLLAVNWLETPPQSVPDNYNSHTENWWW